MKWTRHRQEATPAETALADARKQIAVLQRDLEREREQKQKAIRSITAERDRAKAEAREAKAEADTAKAQADVFHRLMREDAEKYERDRQRAAQEFARLEHAYQQTRAELHRTAEQAMADHRESEALVFRMGEELREARSQRDALHEDRDALHNRLGEVQHELRVAQADYGELQRQEQQARHEAQDLRQKLLQATEDRNTFLAIAAQASGHTIFCGHGKTAYNAAMGQDTPDWRHSDDHTSCDRWEKKR